LVSPFRESGYIIPTSLEQEKVSEIESVATEALKALGVNNIVTHTEIKFTSEGPKIIEINGRPGGTVPFRLKNATCGE
ncbi:ATP-grasp domain-containing protein, partial [Staphylococcus aureus]